MFEYKAECPTWPQLPRADFRENMYTQYSECMPAAVVDINGERSYFDLDRAPEEMAWFYERYLAGETEFCAIGPDYARGFHEFIGRDMPAAARYIKGQVTGPSSLGLTVTDGQGKPVLYHEDLFEALVLALALKGKWQVQRFREKAPGLTPVIFYDEPYLTQLGSALISLPPENVAGWLNQCFEGIDGLTGTHVCGGTDWGLLAGTQVDILHFDAADYSQEFFLYKKEIAAFMERGGMLAWGMIPNNEQALGRNAAALAEELLRGAEKVAGFGPAELGAAEVLERSFVSEACGTGSLPLELAEHCFSLTRDLSDVLRSKMC